MRSGFRLKAYALNSPQLGWRLAGWFARSQPRRLVCPGWFRPGRAGTRWQSGATRILWKQFCNKIDWGRTRLIKECPRNYLLRGVNSMDKPNGRLVLVSCAHCCVSTSSLSTRSSSWALQGDLILERASRLYAFSGYHNRTSLPSRALGRTTGTQEVRPSRSSRTKDSPPQISYAHSR